MDIYGGRDAREVPMYSFTEAARVLRVPASTLRNWTKGVDYANGSRFEPVMPIEQDARAITFNNLIEAYVLSSIRRDYNVPLPVVRESLKFVESEMKVERPLLRQDFLTDGARLFVERWGEIVEASKQSQLAMKELFKGSIKRIDRDERGFAWRLYPWLRSLNEPEIIELDPKRSFGRAVVKGTGIAMDVLISRHRAGDTINRLAKDYSLEQSKVKAVVSWDAQAAA